MHMLQHRFVGHSRSRMLGGTINFEEPGQGTRIVLSAPLHLLRQSKDKLRRAI
jgi:hypothetical protein